MIRDCICVRVWDFLMLGFKCAFINLRTTSVYIKRNKSRKVLLMQNLRQNHKPQIIMKRLKNETCSRTCTTELGACSPIRTSSLWNYVRLFGFLTLWGRFCDCELNLACKYCLHEPVPHRLPFLLLLQLARNKSRSIAFA